MIFSSLAWLTHSLTRGQRFRFTIYSLEPANNGSYCQVRIRLAAHVALHMAFFTIPKIIGPATTTWPSPLAAAVKIIAAAVLVAILPLIRSAVFSGAESKAICVRIGPGKAHRTVLGAFANRRNDLEYETSPSFDAP